MKKLLLLTIVLLTLTSCVKVENNNIEEDLNNLINNLDFNYQSRQDHNAEYFSYYLPSDMQELDATENASVISYNNSKAVMNLNIASIISNKYFNSKTFIDEGFFKEGTLIYENSGQLYKNDDSLIDYNLSLYEAGDSYLIHLSTVELNFYGTTVKEELVDFIRHLFIIAKSTNVDINGVIIAYSAKDVIEYEKKQVNLFNYVIPTSGYISDLIKQSDGVVSNGDNIEAPEFESEPTSEELELEE